MKPVFKLPSGYTVRDAESKADKWLVYKLLILEREKEPLTSNRSSLMTNRSFRILIAFIIALCIFQISLTNKEALVEFLYFFKTNWIYIITAIAFLILPIFILLKKTDFNNYLLADNNTVAIALHRIKIVASSLLGLRGNYCVLLGLYVAPSHRHRGIGSYLLQHTLEGCRYSIYLNTIPELAELYARFGFVKTNKKKGYNLVLNRD